MATIKAIDDRSRHQIQSGQVIVDLNSVVKELVENSLDAGATSIDVRFKNQGLDAIEVQDNGNGIGPQDYETVALKHYTSKLSSFEDLDHVDTFGFRGEALSSLCALSRFHIVTARSVDGAIGKKLDFEVSGKLKGATVQAAQKGTTVSVEEIFYNLPVRRKELEKNIKREYGKVLALLYQYACISTSVRFSVSNQMAKGKKTIAFSTKANLTTKENISNVFGVKTIAALVPLDLKFELQPTATTPGLPTLQKSRSIDDDSSREVIIEGHISKPVFGEGRNAPDRQMFYVNSRPCALPQVSKAINEVYKSFNVSQTPFIFANLKLNTNSYDVNVSPDKRTILLHDQAVLLENLKTALTDLFDQTEQSVPQSTLPQRRMHEHRASSLLQNATSDDTDSQIGSSVPGLSLDEVVPPIFLPASHLIEDWATRDHDLRRPARIRGLTELARGMQHKATGNPEQVEANNDVDESSARSASPDPPGQTADVGVEVASPEDESLFVPEVQADDALSRSRDDNGRTSPDQVLEPPISSFSPGVKRMPPGVIQSAFDRMRPPRLSPQTAEITVGNVTTTMTIGSGYSNKRRRVTPNTSYGRIDSKQPSLLSFGLSRNFAAPGSELSMDAEQDQSQSDAASELSASIVDGEEQEAANEYESDPNGSSPDAAEDDANYPSSDDEHVYEQEKKAREEERVAKLIQEAENTAARPTEDNLKRASQMLKNGGNRKQSTLQLTCDVATSLDDIRTQMDDTISYSDSKHHRSNRASGRFVQDRIDDGEAESRLSLTVSKSDFEAMNIIGQFNLGFILAVRPAKEDGDEEDLFIIDQHAADEKYNYERLQATVEMQSQRLVRPKPLDVTALEAETIINNPEALRANGFEINVAEDEPEMVGDETARTFQLTTLPMSREKTFDLSDLSELLHLLSEHSDEHSGSMSSIPRPRKIQTMLAMRACRSSIMVGKTLTQGLMEKVVRHMGSMEKPWNCPHGRPTMRHLAGLAAWAHWTENDVVDSEECSSDHHTIDWADYLAKAK